MRSNLFWLSDEQWEKIQPPLPTDVRGKEPVDDRRVISGILHVLRSGCQLERLALKRERDRRAMIHKLSQEIGRPPPVDPGLARQMDHQMLRQLAGIPDSLKR